MWCPHSNFNSCRSYVCEGRLPSATVLLVRCSAPALDYSYLTYLHIQCCFKQYITYRDLCTHVLVYTVYPVAYVHVSALCVHHMCTCIVTCLLCTNSSLHAELSVLRSGKIATSATGASAGVLQPIVQVRWPRKNHRSDSRRAADMWRCRHPYRLQESQE